jgi:hypothetical protein
MRTLYCCTAALLLGVACARDAGEATDTAAAATAASPATPADRATRAGEMSKAMAANPAAADSILRANQHTPETFERLMFEIAADSALSATYAAAKAR